MRYALTCLALLAVVRVSSGAVTVDFEDWAGGDGNFTSIDSGGYRFQSTNGVIAVFGSSGTNNNTNSLKPRTPNNGVSVTMTRIGDSTFALTSLDVLESTGAFPSTSITLTGFFDGGGMLSQTFFFDGLGQTFQTFQPTGFTGISSLTLQANGSGLFAVDNLVVPEPVAAMVFVSAMACVARRSGVQELC